MRHFALLVAALACAAPAMAAKPIESDDLSIQSMHNYTACVAERVRMGAIHLLELEPGTSAYKQQMARMAHGTSGYCAPDRDYRFNGILFSGGLAEHLLTKKMDVAEFVRKVAYDPSKPPLDVHGSVDETAVCVVRAEPARTWAIFQTEPTSHDEIVALNAIGPALAGCIPSGKKIALNKQGVRAMLAVASYRLSQPAAGEAQS